MASSAVRNLYLGFAPRLRTPEACPLTVAQPALTCVFISPVAATALTSHYLLQHHDAIAWRLANQTPDTASALAKCISFSRLTKWQGGIVSPGPAALSAGRRSWLRQQLGRHR